MIQRILSIALALCLCISAFPAAYALEGEDSPTEDAESGLTAYADEVTYPTYAEAYQRMIDLQAKYPEGTPWTDKTPYGPGNAYEFKGGSVMGGKYGVGCAAFAFMLSDAAFQDLTGTVVVVPRNLLADYTVKVSDILRLSNKHFVIVTQVTDAGVVIAEGNFNSSVHWGRVLTMDTVKNSEFIATRYPIDFAPLDADEAKEVMAFGDNWKLTKGGAFTVSGAIPDYTDGTQPWYEYMNKIQSIVIGEDVISIGTNAFCGSGAFSVTILGSQMRSIGDGAFQNCKHLVSATIPEGVETIGENAFRGCSNLVSIDLPSTVTSVGDAAFAFCTTEVYDSGLKRVRFAPGNQTVTMGKGLFMGCYLLSEVMLPLHADCISENMFSSCNSLSTLYIPATVTTIGYLAFSNCKSLQTIYFGGTEEAWTTLAKSPYVSSTISESTRIFYNAEFENFFGIGVSEIIGEPGEEHQHSWSWKSDATRHWLECASANCSIGTQNSGTHIYDGDTDTTCSVCGYTRTVTSPVSPEHRHSWWWKSDSIQHWQECGSADCNEPGVKSNAATHSFDRWVIDVSAAAYQNGSRHRDCTVCGYQQTEIIPATGGSSSGRDDGSSDYVSPSSGTTTITRRNPDGSTTKTVTDERTGTITAVTQKIDGSQTVVETKPNGVVATTEISKDGDRIKTVANPDGSAVIAIEQKDGTSAVISTNAIGMVEAEVRLSAPAVNAALQSGTAIALPIPEVPMARDTMTAPAITIHTGSSEPVKVEIPTISTPGTVAVIVHADGSEEIVKTSVPTVDGVKAALPDGATVKIVDNSKDFVDVLTGDWAADAVDFVSARELFAGTTATTFAPEAPMTRAMLMTVLARFSGENTDGGATWYEKGVMWAIANGISDGGSLNDNITREQLVTMLWRHMGSPAASGVLSDFSDKEQISGYAQAAMCWAVENGIVGGFGDGRLGPQGPATRAQVAQILKNFIENMAA